MYLFIKPKDYFGLYNFFLIINLMSHLLGDIEQIQSSGLWDKVRGERKNFRYMHFFNVGYSSVGSESSTSTG